MAASQITVANAKLWYGTAAEITALSTGDGAQTGDVGYATDTNTEYSCIDPTASPVSSGWVITRLHNTAGAAQVTLNTLLSGEDQTNDVLKIEGQYEYETVAASQTDQVIGATGASGDYLHSIILDQYYAVDRGTASARNVASTRNTASARTARD